MRHYNIPIFIPELACPHQCVFCNQEKISGHSEVPQPDEIGKIIDEYLHSFTATERHVNIAFFGGSFTGIERTLQESYLKAANKYVVSGQVDGIRLSTRPDYIDPEIIAMLKTYGVTCIELGAQSMHPEVLAQAGRGHSIQDIEYASKLIKEADIELGLQMMLGLPADSKDRSLFTAHRIVELGADNTRIYPTLVIDGTMLAEMYKDGRYTPLTIEQAVDWAKDVYLYFTEHKITVLRTGLHPAEEFEDGRSLLAGPYHTSFKELMLTAIWKDKFSAIKHTGSSIKIAVAPNQLNYAIGYKQTNRKQMQETWEKVRFVADKQLHQFEFDASYC